jgi:sugar lactone lactonase YvrE
MRIVNGFKTSLLLALLSVACEKGKVVPSGRTGVSGNIETIAGLGPANFGYDGDGGPAKSAKLGYITSIAVDASNNVYITDGASNVVRKINASTSNDVITTIAGTFLGFNVVDPTPFAGDGGVATSAHLNVPLANTVDGSGNVLIVDGSNGLLRKVAADGKISTVAGKPMGQGYEGDGDVPTSATFWNLYGVAVDASGNIYLADAGNNAIRMISQSTGKITTIAGLGPSHGGYSGDNGPAAQAALNSPRAVAVDSKGTLYIADDINHVVRKIEGGVITTLAGTGSQGFSGDGGPAAAATFTSLAGIAVDSDDNLYIADASNNVIRKVTISTGVISRVAGTGSVGYSGDGGSATGANLSGPLGVAVDAAGNVYIADTGNSVIRVVIK